MDDDTRDRLIDLYSRYGDDLTPAQAAERGVTADDHATFMMDMADEHRQRPSARPVASPAPPLTRRGPPGR